MNLIKKFFSYLKRRKKVEVDNVSPPKSNGENFQDLMGMENFQDLMGMSMDQLEENVKESISIGAEFGLIEVTEIDEDGEFSYGLTDKGMKFNDVISNIQSGVLHLDDGEEWVVEALTAMGMNMREADDDEWLTDDEGEMI